MSMTLAFDIALAEVRSCLAGLANASIFDESVHYEHLLLELDWTYPDGPALYPVTGARTELLNRLEVAVDELLNLGVDTFTLELLIAEALK